MPQTVSQDGPDTALARLLLATGRLSLDVLRPALAAARLGGPSLATRLIEQGHVGQDEVEQLIRAPREADSSEDRRVDTLLSGEAFGRFEITGELGRGGMGVVYRARDTLLDREVAIKSLQLGPGTDAIELERFRREAQTLAQLKHPGLVRVHEVIPESALGPCIVMDYVPGQTLGDLLERGGPLEPERAIAIALEVAEAVGHAHAHDVIHRDLKPANIMLRPNGQVVVLDFGLARRVADDSSLTSAGEVVGTPEFMAPEQALARPLDVRTDVYALGVILYVALQGSRPFQGNSALAIFNEVLNVTAPPLLGVGPALAEVVATCLEKDPYDRYRDLPTLARALRRALEVQPPLPSPAPSRSASFMAAVVGVVALVGVGVAVWVQQERQEAPAAPTARPSADPPASPSAPPDDVPTLVARLPGLLAAGQPAERIALARRILALEPTNTAAHHALIDALRAEGRLTEARAAADRALVELDLGFALLWVDRARVHLDADRLREAIRDANAALQRSPSSPTALTVRGQAYLRLGSLRRARADLDRAIARSPSLSALEARALARARLGDRAGALADLAVVRARARTSLERRRLRELEDQIERARPR